MLDKVRIFDGHIFRVSTEDRQLAIVEVDLGSFSVILVFAGELLSFKSIENFGNSFSRLGQHRFERDAYVFLGQLISYAGLMVQNLPGVSLIVSCNSLGPPSRRGGTTIS